jgi:hypothetical protein
MLESMICRNSVIMSCIGFMALLAPRAGRAYVFDAQVQAWEDNYQAVPIDLEGRVVDEHGSALIGAQLRVIGWGASFENDGEATNSWEGGSFELLGLARANVLVKVDAPGYYSEIVTVDLQQPLAEDIVDLGDVVLYEKRFDRVRLTFGGDVMFARRYFDADEDGVLGEPGDLLRMQTLTADTARLFRYVEVVLEADDLTSVNLETPVTADLSTPHPVKDNVFNAYPASAAALEQVGVDVVTLGNNHVYDYLDDGTEDTIDHLEALGMPWVGAGMNDTQARNSWRALQFGEIDLAMQGFNNQQGTDYGDSDLYVTAANPDKPGSLWSSDSRIEEFFDDASGYFAIGQFHGGTEYAFAQSSGMRSDFETAIDAGAGLVIAHHPHVVHGVTTYDGGDGPRYVFGSIGNFMFDQERYATFSSYLVSVDLEQGPDGVEVARVWLRPMHLDGFVPRLLAGIGVAELGRYVAQLGTEEDLAGGFDRAVVFAEGGKLVVAMRENQVSTTDLLDQRAPVALVNGSTGPVQLAPYSDNDALAKLATSAAATCELGFDRMQYGDFEDRDVDDRAAEGDRWAQTSARYVQRHTVRSGQAAAVLLRSASNNSTARLTTIATVPVTAGRKVSVAGWSKGTNAGKFAVSVSWKRSSGSTISSTTSTIKAGGTWGWQAFTLNLTAPASAATVELSYAESPPGQGEGLVFLDDLQLLEWDVPTLAVTQSGTTIPTPNGWDAVRCAAGGASLGLTLTHRVYETPPT